VHATHTMCCTHRRTQVYLVDSGAQYRDGTTDVTRTIVFNNVTRDREFLREMYTLVLKARARKLPAPPEPVCAQGHIRLAMQLFPDNCNGMRLDTLSRASMWQIG
jgi:Xaa-Pro aminopeptidase